jgi:glycerol-3-phosphate acyltransferase PlsY
MLSVLLIIVASYLVGAIPSSVWIGRGLYGVDIREHGSMNAGATNAFRVLGWKVGVLATCVDLGKGILAATLIASLRIDPLPAALALGSSWNVDIVIRLLAGVSAIVGHMFPVYARFEGGKGVNTSAGVLFALTPVTMTITAAIFLVVLLASRYVSLASMLAAASFPTIVAIRRYLFQIDSLDPSLLVVGTLLAIAIIVAHRSNIKRLLRGNENRVRSFKPARGRLNKSRHN